jgi:hypothetical protein
MFFKHHSCESLGIFRSAENPRLVRNHLFRGSARGGDARGMKKRPSRDDDRQQLIDLVWQGASKVSSLPMPDYPPLRPYFDHVKDLLAKYDTVEFNPKKGRRTAQRQGVQEGQ